MIKKLRVSVNRPKCNLKNFIEFYENYGVDITDVVDAEDFWGEYTIDIYCGDRYISNKLVDDIKKSDFLKDNSRIKVMILAAALNLL